MPKAIFGYLQHQTAVALLGARHPHAESRLWRSLRSERAKVGCFRGCFHTKRSAIHDFFHISLAVFSGVINRISTYIIWHSKLFFRNPSRHGTRAANPFISSISRFWQVTRNRNCARVALRRSALPAIGFDWVKFALYTGFPCTFHIMRVVNPQGFPYLPRGDLAPLPCRCARLQRQGSRNRRAPAGAGQPRPPCACRGRASASYARSPECSLLILPPSPPRNARCRNPVHLI